MRGLDIKGQGNKISVKKMQDAYKKKQLEQKLAQLQYEEKEDFPGFQAQLDKMNADDREGEFLLSPGLDNSQHIAMLQAEAAAGQEWAAIELSALGEKFQLPDADASHLTANLLPITPTLKAIQLAKLGLGARVGAKMTDDKVIKAMTAAKEAKKARNATKVSTKVATEATEEATEKALKTSVTKKAADKIKETPGWFKKTIMGDNFVERAAQHTKWKMPKVADAATQFVKDHWTKILMGSGAYGVGNALYNKYQERSNATQSQWVVGPDGKKVKVDPERKEHAEGGFSLENILNNGAQQVPGGVVSPLGDEAVQFDGNEHDQAGNGSDSGIIIGPKSEVENGETLTTVDSSDGPQEYIFSQRLEMGGIPFSEHHKQMVHQGSSQEQINYLAKMQEHVAGRDPQGIQIASTGGKKRFSGGGPYTSYGDNYDLIESLSQESGYAERAKAGDLGESGIAAMQNQNEDGSYGESDISSEESRKDFYSRNENILKSMGVNSWEEFNPSEHASEYQSAYNKHLEKRYDSDESFRKSLDDKGISKEDYMKSGFSSEKNIASSQDGLYGEYTFSRSEYFKPESTVEPPIEKEKFVKSDLDFSEEYENSLKGKEEENKFDWVGKAAALAPGLAAWTMKPDYMEDADKVAPGVVVAEREAKQNLERVDYTDQLARNSNDTQAMNKYIETSGGGSSNIINKMAMFSKKAAQDSAIKSAESNVNMQIGNQEAGLNSAVGARNASNALNASTTNADNILQANTTNTQNTLAVNKFNAEQDSAQKDRRLDALQYTVGALGTMRSDNLKYKAGNEVAKAISGKTGIYDAKAMETMLAEYGFNKNKA